MKEITNEEREILRRGALEVLAVRHPAALPLAGIARRLRTAGAGPAIDFEFTNSDLESALNVLEEMELVKGTFDELGSSRWWRATATGVLKQERAGKV